MFDQTVYTVHSDMKTKDLFFFLFDKSCLFCQTGKKKKINLQCHVFSLSFSLCRGHSGVWRDMACVSCVPVASSCVRAASPSVHLFFFTVRLSRRQFSLVNCFLVMFFQHLVSLFVGSLVVFIKCIPIEGRIVRFSWFVYICLNIFISI